MLREEFDQWVEAHYDELVTVARRLVNNHEDAAEVVHDAVVRALSNGRLFQVRRPWTWMVNVVRSTAEHRRRADSRQNSLLAGVYHFTQEEVK